MYNSVGIHEMPESDITGGGEGLVVTRGIYALDVLPKF